MIRALLVLLTLLPGLAACRPALAPSGSPSAPPTAAVPPRPAAVQSPVASAAGQPAAGSPSQPASGAAARQPPAPLASGRHVELRHALYAGYRLALARG